MYKIFNGTPHSINIIREAVFKPEIRKFVVPFEKDVTVIASIPSDGVLSAKIDTIDLPDIDGIPVYGKSIVGCDPLPEGYDIYIVSALYVSAMRAIDNFIFEPSTDPRITELTVDAQFTGDDLYSVVKSLCQGNDISKLYTVADPVYSEDGRTILGCRGICPAF